MSSTFGTGGVTMLKAVGKQDTIMNEPENSYFKPNYTEQNKFARFYRSFEQSTTDNTTSWPYGNEIVFKIDPKNSGDLLSNMYLQLELPDINFNNERYGTIPTSVVTPDVQVSEQLFGGGGIVSYANIVVVSSNTTVSQNVYVFSETNEFWTQVKRLNNDGAFGASLALDGSTLAIGAPYTGSNVGNVYLYDYDWTETYNIESPTSTADDRFGWSLTLGGGDLAIGTPGDTSNTGAVYIYDPITATQQVKISGGSSTTTESDFGYSVDINNGTLVVGSIRESTNGAVYVFTGSGSSWTEQARLLPVYNNPIHINFRFGFQVLAKDDYIFVASSYGNVYAYNTTTYTLDSVLSNAGYNASYPSRINYSNKKLYVYPEKTASVTYIYCYVYTKVNGAWTLINRLKSEYLITTPINFSTGHIDFYNDYVYVTAQNDFFSGGGSNAGALFIYKNVTTTEYVSDLPPYPPPVFTSNVWTDRIGRSLIEYCTFEVDGTVLETVDDYMHVVMDDVYSNEQFRILRNLTQNGVIADDVKNTVFPDFDKSLPINYISTVSGANLGYYSKNSVGQNIFLDLRFFFSRNYNPLPGSKNFNSTHYSHIGSSFGTQPNFNNYFPLCAITNEYVYVRIKFRPVEWFTNFPFPITSKIKLISEEITVSNQERLYYMNSPLTQSYTFTEKQYSGPFNKGTNKENSDSELVNRHKLYSSGKLKQFIWFLQNEKYKTLTSPSNDFLFLNRYNFSSYENTTFQQGSYQTIESEYPLLSEVALETGNYDIRLSAGSNQQAQNSAKYFRNIDGPIRGLHIPLRNIYTYSFDPDPKVYMESGFENTSIQKSTEEYTLENTLINTPEVLTANLYNLFIYNRVTRTIRFENGFCMFTD